MHEKFEECNAKRNAERMKYRLLKYVTNNAAVRFASLLMALTCLSAVPDNVAAGEFEVGGAVGYAACIGDYCYSDGVRNGIAFSFGLGYKFTNWFGVVAEQDLSGVYVYNKYWNFDEWEFVGSTFVAAKFYLSVAQNFEFTGKIGAGATYGKDKWDDESAIGIAIRLGVGATYRISQQLGVGIIFDYEPSFCDRHNLKIQFGVVCNFL